MALSATTAVTAFELAVSREGISGWSIRPDPIQVIEGRHFKKAFHPEVVRAKIQGYPRCVVPYDGFVTELSIEVP